MLVPYALIVVIVHALQVTNGRPNNLKQTPDRVSLFAFCTIPKIYEH